MKEQNETRKLITGSEILKHRGRLCEVIGYTEGNKVVYMRVLRDEDKDKCPHCNKPIETNIDIVENCRNWETDIEPVKTI